MSITTIKRNKVDIHSSDSFNSSPNLVPRQTPTAVDIDIINQLDIADGLRELLLRHGFTIELLLRMTSNDLAETLGIDKYVAMIIKDAAIKRIKKK